MDNPTMVFALRGEGTDTLEIDVYDTIGETWWGEGVSAKSVRRALKNAPSAKLIKLRVNSRGGDVFDGHAIYNLLNDHSARVVAHIDALAASMASVIVMAADEIQMASNAMMMIHNPWTIALGEADDLRGTADLLDKLRGQIADAYVARTSLERDRVIEMMDDETWLTAAEAKELGFTDVVKSSKKSGSAKAFASLDLRGFSRAPAEFAVAVAQARYAMYGVGEAPRTNEPQVANTGGAEDRSSAECGREKEQKMDLKTLKAQHPETYEAAVQEGVNNERKRVNAHLKLAESSGAMDVAKKAIASGVSTMDEEVHAEYLAAGMNRSDRETRQTETDQAGKAVDSVEGDETPRTMLDQAADAFLGSRKEA